MKPSFCAFAVTLWLAGISASDTAFAQKAGGILKNVQPRQSGQHVDP